MSSKVRASTSVTQPRDLCMHPISTLGHLGKFTLSLHWMNLGNQPVEVLIEDVYLLVTPSPQGEEDPEDEANRAHAAKMERLENAELLHMRSQSEVATGSLPSVSPGPITLRSFRWWFYHPEDTRAMSAILSAIYSISCLRNYHNLMYSRCYRGLPEVPGSHSLAHHQDCKQSSGDDQKRSHSIRRQTQRTWGKFLPLCVLTLVYPYSIDHFIHRFHYIPLAWRWRIGVYL